MSGVDSGEANRATERMVKSQPSADNAIPHQLLF